MRIVETRRIGEDVRVLLQPRREEAHSSIASNAPPRAALPAPDA
jgi:hypothetical protein